MLSPSVILDSARINFRRPDVRLLTYNVAGSVCTFQMAKRSCETLRMRNADGAECVEGLVGWVRLGEMEVFGWIVKWSDIW